MFTCYKGMAHDARQAHTVRTERPTLFQALEDGIGWLVRNVADHDTRVCTVANWLLEVTHYDCGHHVINIPADLAEELSQTEYDLELDGLKLPYSLFEVCIEDAFRPFGQPLPGCLVSMLPDEATLAAIDNICKRVRTAEVRSFSDSLRNQIRYMHRYEIGHGLGLRNEFGDGHGINSEQISYADHKGQKIEEVMAGWPIQLHDGEPPETAKRVREEDTMLLRMILGAVIYMNIPDHEQELFKDPNRPHFGNKPPNGILLGRNAKCFYLRRAHWRILRHQCFRRNPDGTVRVLWIKPAAVNVESMLKDLPPKETELVEHE